jgi:hypothetical protein
MEIHLLVSPLIILVFLTYIFSAQRTETNARIMELARFIVLELYLAASIAGDLCETLPDD